MKLDNLIDNTNDAILAVNINFDIIEYNKAFAKGIQDDLNLRVNHGDNILIILKNISPQWYNAVKTCFERALHGERFSFIFENASAQLWKHVEATCAPLTDQEGRIMGATLFAHNVTQESERRITIENIVKNSLNLIGQQYFEYLTDQLSKLFSVKYTYVGKVEENNNQIETIALRKNGKLIENLTYSLPGTACQTIVQREEARYIEKVALLFPHDTKLIKWKAESYLGVPITSPAGEILGVLVLIHDQPWQETPDADYILTVFAIRAGAELYHQKAEQQLRQKERQLSRLSKHVPEMIFEYILWPDGSEAFLYVSEACRDIFEMEPEALLQDPSLIWQAIHPEDFNRFAQQYQQLTGRDKLQWIGRIRTLRSGKEKWVKVTSSPESIYKGIIKSYGIIDDISAQIEVEQALWKAKESAEQAARAKEEFLAHMSHEIRTPLNAVVGLSNLLLQQDPKAEQLENLQSLKFSAENLMVLVNDILDFSKIQAGKVEVEETEVNIRELLNSLQRGHQLRAQEQDNELQVHVDKQIPAVVRTDQLKLSQVLHNLIGNAVKFTHQGLVTVEVSLNRKEADRLWIEFSVRDTGIGIPQDKLSSIFDAFTQADISTVRQYGGTGLGLSITKLLLELLGSRIEVESQPGKGSCFFFNLPVREATAAVDTVPEESPDETTDDEQVQADLRQMKLLIVEDVAINRMIIMQFLQDWWQLTPDEAADGEQAVAMAQQKQYDMILMDVRMPIMNGYLAAQAIRSLKSKHYQHVPIIALTADTAQEIKKHTEEASLFSDIITKPFSPQDLRQKLLRYVPDKYALNALPSDVPNDELNHVHADTTISSSEVNLKKLSQFFKHDSIQINAFLAKAISELTVLQERFSSALKAGNEAEIGNIIHKGSLLLSLLSLQTLKKSLKRGQSLVAQEPAPAQINEVQKKVKTIIEQTVTSLKKHLEKV